MSRVTTASSPTAGEVADRKSAREAARADGSTSVGRTRLAILLPLANTMLGCQLFSVGLPTDGSSGITSGWDVASSTSTDALLAPAIDASSYDGPVPGDVAPVYGVPLLVGCSDGTREGFRDINKYSRIAGCAGGWQVPGLLTESARAPQCLRRSGNDGLSPEGRACLGDACVDCSASDLCASFWHACLSGSEVADRSSTGCEGMLPPGEEGFFVVMTGASSEGVCYPDGKNDLHGCGNLGEPESDQCPPLTRRMNFADCLATEGVWQCGDANRSLTEAETVRKPNSSLGGVLCCKD